MMKDLYILGAGGFGRELHTWLSDEQVLLQRYRLRGFIDDAPTALDVFAIDAQVVNSFTDLPDFKHSVFVCGVGNVALKRQLCEPMLKAGAEFVSLIHPSARVGPRVKLGRGVVICPGVTLTCDIEVGDLAMVNCHSTAGHDVVIESWTTISGHCDLTGGSRVGEGAFLGSGVRVIPGKRVGSGATVGAGSVVIRHVAEGARVFGNPARSF
ncbi:acetyltransferase [Coraliomargarita sp. SDUM461004]|uniref:Acetyltransferase n=1 Tax=Thalassobacterium sedimentorum TaxID=3041258 RepID=A0ABU1AFM9_9BACT|nr:acetyltransferase [Coraliomargarita sp. SDUM461004]MDQ8193575.1 acetyltransferase [Coraliomargarita sp. SDUM461004]